MAILRSRGAPNGALTIDSPSVRRSLKQWEDRVSEERLHAHAEARQEAEQAMGLRVKKAEEAAKKAEQERVAGVAAAEATVDDRIKALDEEWLGRWRGLFGRAAALEKAVEEIEPKAIRAAEHQVVALALALAQKVLRHEIDNDQQWFVDALQTVLNQVPDRRSTTLRLHNEDAQEMAKYFAVLREKGEHPIEPHIQVDPDVEKGTLLVESGGTRIDASPLSCLKRIGEDLLQAAPSAEWQQSVEPVDPTEAFAEDKAAIPPDVELENPAEETSPDAANDRQSSEDLKPHDQGPEMPDVPGNGTP